ncbi:hypothetical protein VFPPC_11887 [Pochonia chlamydosporia 170]|uniref:Uncharacterized protein n=1 Tax=Pochonia chlamydosporia 170 TaxID=1380566 RepID=A0A179F0G1_METCM|nr:hypothetical protein VFPPC_11887 [Pochonia chlamydosporia 170]OAQ58945.1 hypothetical protein VFPPC_11887 [Pochonia chlamydosporia 170]
MPQALSNQKPTARETRPASPVSQDEAMCEGLWMQEKGNPDHNQGLIGKDRSTTPHIRQNIPYTEQLIAVPSDVAEMASHRSPSLEKFGKAGLVSGIQNLGLENEKAHRNPAHAGIGGVMQCFQSANCSMGLRDPSQDALPGSSLNNMTEESQLKWGQGEGINLNDLLSNFVVSKDDTEETVSDNDTSDNGIDKRSIHKPRTSLGVLGDRIDYGGMDASDCLPPWTKTLSGDDTAETEAKNMCISTVCFADPGGIDASFGLPEWDEDKFKQLVAEDQQQEVVVLETTHTTTSNIR